MRSRLGFVLGSLVSALISLVTLPVLSWMYSTEDIGRLSILQILVLLLVVLVSIGLDQAYVREYHAKDKRVNNTSLIFNHVMPGVVVFLIVSSLILFNKSVLVELLFDSYDAALILYLLSIVFITFLMNHASIIFRMKGEALLFSCSLVIPKALFLLITLLCYMFVENLFFSNIAQSLLVSLLLSVFVLVLIVKKGKWLGAYLDIKYLADVLKYSFPIMVSAVLFWMVLAVDRFSLKFLSDLNQLALYSIAFTFAGAGLLLQNIFSMLWFPEVYKEYEKTGDYKNLEMLQEVMVFICVLIFGVVGLLSPIIPFVLPAEYNNVQYLIMASIAYPIFLVISEVTGVGIGLKRKTMFTLLSTLIAFLINLIGNFLLVPSMGASGAVVSSAISFYVFVVLKTEFSCRLWKKTNRFKMYVILTGILFLSISFVLFETRLASFYFSVGLLLSCPWVFKNQINYILTMINKKGALT